MAACTCTASSGLCYASLRLWQGLQCKESRVAPFPANVGIPARNHYIFGHKPRLNQRRAKSNDLNPISIYLYIDLSIFIFVSIYTHTYIYIYISYVYSL